MNQNNNNYYNNNNKTNRKFQIFHTKLKIFRNFYYKVYKY